MTIPSAEQMRQDAKAQQAAQDLAFMVEQVMLRCPEYDEGWCIARAKVILSAKAHVLAAPAGLGGPAQVAPTQPIANVFEAGIRAATAAQQAVQQELKGVLCK